MLGSSASLLACSLLATGLTASSVVVLPSAAKAFEASAAVALAEPVSQSVPVAQSVPVSQEDAYVLGPGDGLQLRFFGATELSGPVEVLSDGNVSLPLLGPVRLTGLTLPQANQWLELIYKKQLLRPELQLSLVRPRPLRVALVGEVERPGLYTLTSTEQSQTEAKVSISGLPTLVDAIQKAGGITPMANLREVTLQRRLPGEPLRYKRTSVDLLALVQQGDQQQNPILFDGDTIRIDQASEPVAEVIELASTTLSPDTISVNVIGEVLRAGTLPLPANTPLVQAVLAAGGPQTWRASKGNVELVRINRNGTATRQRFQLNLSQGASNTKNPPLRDGDTVVVNRSGMAVASDAIGAVSTPLTGLVNILALVDLINKD